MPNVAVYARVSTDEQATAGTIDNQLHAIREYCASRGYSVVAEFCDEGVSGTVPFEERQQAARLLAMAGEGLFDRAIIYRLDRLARDMAHGLVAFRQLQKARVSVESVSETWDDSPSGRFMYREFLNIAELEKDMIRDRTMRGRERRIRGGKYQASQAPFGYNYVTCGQAKCDHPQCGKLEINPEQAKIVRQMFRWASKGQGLRQIAGRLNDQAVPPPNPEHPKRQSKWGWHYTTVYKILTSPRYKGESSYGYKKGVKAGLPMPCPALVGAETFRAAGEALRRRRIDSPRNTKHSYLLQHRLYCRTCGSRFRGRHIKDQYVYRPDGHLAKLPLPKARTIYTCGQRDRYGPSAGHENARWRIRGDEVEREVMKMIDDLRRDPDWLADRVEAFWNAQYAAGEELEAERQSLLDHLGDLLKRRERIVEAFGRGALDEDDMKRELTKIAEERDIVQKRVKDLSPADGTPIQPDLLREHLRRLVGRIKKGEIPTGGIDGTHVAFAQPAYREALETIAQRIWVEADGSLTWEIAGKERRASQFKPSR